MNTDRIEKKILLRAPRKRVWRALADSTEFGSWFGIKFEGAFTPGARLRGTIVALKDDSLHLRVPPDNLRIEVTRSSIVSVTTPDETAAKTA